MGRHRSSSSRRHRRRGSRSPSYSDDSQDARRRRRSRSASRSRDKGQRSSSRRREKSTDREKDKRREEKKRKQEERKRREEEKKRQKETETPEERMRRRLAKKAEKEKQRREDNEVCGYTNDDNPFGDSRLTQRFQWKKRDETRVDKGLPAEEYTKKRERERRKEIENEVQKVKRRRQEREEERKLMEKERERMNRMRDAAENMDWHRQEQEFHLNMSKMRTAIRLQEGRARPIDTLSKNLGVINPDNPDEELEVEVDLAEPYKVFTTLPLDQLEETCRDIEEKLKLGDEHTEYWELLLLIGKDHVDGAQEHSKEHRDQNAVVSHDMVSIFAGKSVEQLNTLQEEIEHKLETDANVDHAYWQLALQKLRVHRAKARLRDMHADLLGKRLAQLEAQMGDDGSDGDDGASTGGDVTAAGTSATATAAGAEDGDDKKGRSDGDKGGRRRGRGDGGGEEEAQGSATRARAVSPTPFASEAEARAALDALVQRLASGDKKKKNTATSSQSTHITVIEDPTRDTQALKDKREQVLSVRIAEYREQLEGITGDKKPEGADDVIEDNSAEAQYRREIRKLGGDFDKEHETAFTQEASIPARQQVYTWQDKYRPRKPRYFNRVRTGFEWNKYNQTHYDKDNPPPKTIQGYKFNIFYPDLIDPSKTPTYHLSAGPTSDTAMLRFSGGPPYEDIAFVIPNREWQTSHRRGFKCTFERGVLHLWFNFSRAFYRR